MRAQAQPEHPQNRLNGDPMWRQPFKAVQASNTLAAMLVVPVVEQITARGLVEPLVKFMQTKILTILPEMDRKAQSL
jgi:hypothetical protein